MKPLPPLVITNHSVVVNIDVKIMYRFFRISIRFLKCYYYNSVCVVTNLKGFYWIEARIIVTILNVLNSILLCYYDKNTHFNPTQLSPFEYVMLA